MFYKKKFHGEEAANHYLQSTNNVSADQLIIQKNFDKIPNQEVLDPISPIKNEDYTGSPYKENYPGHKMQNHFDQNLDQQTFPHSFKIYDHKSTP